MKPTIKNNSLHPNTKYVNKNMYMTDNEDNEVIEDSLTKDEKFKKERNKRVKQLIALRAPDVIVEREKYIATLTIAEYKNLLNEEEKEEKKFLNEYMKENPLNKDVVDSLFDAFEELLNAPEVKPMMDSFIRFTHELDPLKYVSRYEYDIGVYDPLIESFFKEYGEKRRKEIDLWYGDDGELYMKIMLPFTDPYNHALTHPVVSGGTEMFCKGINDNFQTWVVQIPYESINYSVAEKRKLSREIINSAEQYGCDVIVSNFASAVFAGAEIITSHIPIMFIEHCVYPMPLSLIHI